ncbi:uncharacterized protein G2W53_027798 [Senna tora]|uniref:Uncharacterized protein n=1 Tax=Senna tora TaxID=362788 RepID=A0A834THM0_9FABA|nr:uncharacterized protein G2W53_027798 [Senna tora]
MAHDPPLSRVFRSPLSLVNIINEYQSPWPSLFSLFSAFVYFAEFFFFGL